MKKRSLSVILPLFLCIVGATAQIKQSSGNEEYWYNLLSAKSGLENLVISENPDAESAFPIAVVAQDVNDHSQQWKFVLVEGTRNNYYIVNRKSGKQILATSLAQGAYNATQLGADATDKGLKVDDVVEGQYAIYGTEEDGIVRYLALQELSGAVEVLNKKELANSAFAWTMQLVDGTGIAAITAGGAVITVKNRQIVVENAVDYSVTNLSGVEFPKNAILEQGVYVVTVGGLAKNVYVE